MADKLTKQKLMKRGDVQPAKEATQQQEQMKTGHIPSTTGVGSWLHLRRNQTPAAPEEE